MLLRILLAVPDPERRHRMRALLEPSDCHLVEVASPAELSARVKDESFDLLLASPAFLREPAARFAASLQRDADPPGVILLSDKEDAEARASFLAQGGLAVLYEGVSDTILGQALRALVDRQRDQARYRLRAGEPASQSKLSDFATESPAMRRCMRVARQVVRSDSTVLIHGETGVGKEWLARALHAEGPRAQAPFVAVNCGALSENLLESELFGHEKGAFTGALRAHRGYFELAHRGTVFLDEIGELPLHLQVKLLRVLEERVVRPVGGERNIAVDVRVMVATHRDLERQVAAGLFRSDLFYRLNVIALTLPPLRERREDIPALLQGYVEHFRTRLRSSVTAVQPLALRALVEYSWPGNVRELINVIERATLMCPGSEIAVADLPEAIQRSAGAPADLPTTSSFAHDRGDGTWASRPWRDVRQQVLQEAERRYLSELLATTGGRIQEAAARARMNPRSLFDKLRHHGIRKEDYRGERVDGGANPVAPPSRRP